VRDAGPPQTRVLGLRDQSYFVRRFAATVVQGPDVGARVVSTSEELTIGTEEGNQLRLTDAAVSRHHAMLRATERGLEVRDLNSTNGTYVGHCRLGRGVLRAGAHLELGQTIIAVEVLDDEIEQPLAPVDRFGELRGTSPAMRRLYPVLERCAATTATVLLSGETGTGKEVAAHAIHARSDRRDHPFVIVDCGALPRELMESELFGHERGAFTGADVPRVGAFQAADGGTIFLDEIGELPLELQPVLLRVLESRRFRSIGGSTEHKVDVRIIAATNRDLRAEVNQRRFRADLFFRLNVIGVELPPLRERTGDIDLLVADFWAAFRGATPVPSELASALRKASWPGNVRELRNAVERAALVGWRPAAPTAPETWEYSAAKDALLFAWEKDFVERLLQRANGNLSLAAKLACTSRSHLRLLMQRHGIERADFTE